MKNCRSVIRRPILLLEVIIAFALVALCVLPLIYPHVFILRSEKQFVSEVELDHRVSLIYADIMEKLYRKEIPWQDIIGQKETPIDLSGGSRKDEKGTLPYKGSYKFVKYKQKAKDEESHNMYLFRLIFSFQPVEGLLQDKDRKPLTYEYLIPIERKVNE